MSWWIPLTVADLPMVLNAKELAVLTLPDNQTYVTDILEDLVAVVRESIANNPANTLDPDRTTIPRTLRAMALSLATVQLLKRFALAISDDRREAALKAEERLAAIARAEFSVIDVHGDVPVPAGDIPEINAPTPAYGNDGVGFYPLP